MAAASTRQINQPGAAPGSAVAVAAPAAARAAAAIVPSAEDFIHGVLQWVPTGAIKGRAFGTVVTCSLPLVKDQPAVCHWAASEDVFVKCVDGQDLVSFRSVPSGWDRRLLLVLRCSSGPPQRTLSCSVRDSKQEAADWIIMVPGDVRSAG